MRIGDKVKIPIGSRKGQEAIVRDIKGSNIWLYLPKKASPAVMFHIGDFPVEDCLEWVKSNNNPKPEKPNFWIIYQVAGGNASTTFYFDKNEAIRELDEKAKEHTGYVFCLMEIIRKVSYEQTLTKSETVY